MRGNYKSLIVISVLISVVISAVIIRNADSSRNIKDNSSFLMFPTDQSYMYKTKYFKDTEILGKTERAVIVSCREAKSGIVKIIVNEKEDGYVKLSTLRYLPPDNYSKYIKDLEDVLHYQGYTSGKFVIKPLDSKVYSIVMVLKDSKHARQHEYRYKTDGDTVFEIKPIRVTSGLWYIHGMLTWFVVFMFVIIMLKFIVDLLSMLRRRHKI